MLIFLSSFPPSPLCCLESEGVNVILVHGGEKSAFFAKRVAGLAGLLAKLSKWTKLNVETIAFAKTGQIVGDVDALRQDDEICVVPSAQ